MKTLIFALLALSMTACASKPVGYQLPIALSETLRNGELRGLEHADGPDLGMPNSTDLSPRTCTSTPIFDLYGYYVRTVVHCM
jgi:hypothetical protein